MLHSLQQLLSLIKSGELTMPQLQKLLADMRTAINTDPTKSVELGPYINQVNKIVNGNQRTDFAAYDENMTQWIDYTNCDRHTWPYQANDDAFIESHFKYWLAGVTAFPNFTFLFDKDHGSEYLHYNFHTVTVRERHNETAETGIVFMIHRHVPLAVWGTGSFRIPPPGIEHYDKWYIAPENLYVNTLGESYTPVIDHLTKSLVQQGVNFTAKPVLLRPHQQPQTETKYLNIDIDGSLSTLYGYTFNVHLTWMVD